MVPQLGERRVRRVAEHHRVCAAQHAEQRAPAAAVLGGAGDQARDLDELHANAANERDGRHRPRGRERVVAGLDLDARERLQERRLARVRRPDERDLRRAVAVHGQRVAVHGLLAHS
jgi:hypothetical protein